MYPNLVVAQKGLDFLDCFVAHQSPPETTQELGRTCLKGNEHNKLPKPTLNHLTLFLSTSFNSCFLATKLYRTSNTSQIRYKVTELKYSHQHILTNWSV